MSVYGDLRHAVRTLLERPALTATAVASLSIGIGANTALLSLADGLGLRPLPIERPGRLVRIFASRAGATSGNFSFPDYRDLAGSAPAFADVAAYGNRGVALTGGDGPAEVVMAAVITGNYFDTLGVRPEAGRLLRPPDDSPSGAGAVVISDRLWRQRYAGDRFATGRSIALNGRSFAIAGILPRDFTGLDPLFAPDVWATTAAWPLLNGSRGEFSDRANQWLRVVGRLRDGHSLAEASEQVAALMAGLARTYPETNRGRGSRLIPDAEYRRRVGVITLSVLGTIGSVVLLLACANVAALLLARAEERRHEMAVRAAMGAGRARLAGQLLTEGITLAALAAGSGIAVARWLIRLLPLAIPPSPIPLGLEFRLDARVTAFAVVLAAFTVVLFALAPAISGSRVDPATILKASGAGSKGGRSRVRHILVASQIALSLTLVTTAAFLIRSVWNLDRVDAGFDRRPTLMLTLSPSAVGYDGARARAFYEALMERAGALPGVQLVTLARRVPLSTSGGGATVLVNVPGRVPPEGDAGFNLHYNTVGPHYFQLMGTPIVRGRDFSRSDSQTSRRVVIVSEEFARRFASPNTIVGTEIQVGATPSAMCEVVGVARDGKYNSLTESPDPYVYFPFSQRFFGEATLLVRTTGDERPLMAALRREMASIDRMVPALQVMTMASHLRAATMIERVTATLVTALGALGLFLALAGLYGLASYLASRRTREIGIRMALGARPADISRQMLRQAAAPVVSGIAGGLALAFLVTAFAARSMYGISARDPLTYGGTAAMLAAVTTIASMLPARRAARVDPSSVLRE